MFGHKMTLNRKCMPGSRREISPIFVVKAHNYICGHWPGFCYTEQAKQPYSIPQGVHIPSRVKLESGSDDQSGQPAQIRNKTMFADEWLL